VVNLDTTSAVTFVSEGSPVRHQLKALVTNDRLVMTQTAVREFQTIVGNIAGPLERARALRLLQRVATVNDQASARAQALRVTGRLSASDIVILGTGDQLGATTLTGDGKAVRAAAAQGVTFTVAVHQTIPLTGK
jgi:uncharacterized protein DUF1308